MCFAAGCDLCAPFPFGFVPVNAFVSRRGIFDCSSIKGIFLMRASAQVFSPIVQSIAINMINGRISRICDYPVHILSTLLPIVLFSSPHRVPSAMSVNCAPLPAIEPLIISIIDDCDFIFCQQYLFAHVASSRFFGMGAFCNMPAPHTECSVVEPCCRPRQGRGSPARPTKAYVPPLAIASLTRIDLAAPPQRSPVECHESMHRSGAVRLRV